MNLNLLQKFSNIWNPWFSANENDGVSSISGTAELRPKILDLFAKYNIKSIFDSGSNDCGWMNFIAKEINYHGGDISVNMVNHAKNRFPDLDIVLHDITTDDIPAVDCLFSRDVAIHLNNQDKHLMWQNWYRSGVPWILTTNIDDCEQNLDFDYNQVDFPFAEVNWKISPWNFPDPVDHITEQNLQGRTLSLWHRDQFKGIL